MCVELLRNIVIFPPCKPYSKWVLTFSARPPEACWNCQGSERWTVVEKPRAIIWALRREQSSSLLHPGGEIGEGVLCLSVGTEPHSASSCQLDQCLLRELHRSDCPIRCYGNLDGPWRVGSGMERDGTGRSRDAPCETTREAGQGWRGVNWQYTPLPFLSPLKCPPFIVMGSRGWAKREVQGLQHPAQEAAVPRLIFPRKGYT